MLVLALLVICQGHSLVQSSFQVAVAWSILSGGIEAVASIAGVGLALVELR